jgi:hypothetical protein
VQADQSKTIAERRKWYADVYLKSSHWRRTRLAAIERAGRRCKRCRDTPPVLHVHHRSYARLWCELPGDLEVLCEDCHRRAHGVSAQGKSPKARRGGGAKRRAERLRRDGTSVLLAIDERPRSTADVATLAGITPERAIRALHVLLAQGKVRHLEARGVWWE